jgi:hypothetical protein
MAAAAALDPPSSSATQSTGWLDRAVTILTVLTPLSELVGVLQEILILDVEGNADA